MINFKNSDFCDCAISALQISKKHFAMFDLFCKNEACVNCGTLNATTLICLVRGRKQCGLFRSEFLIFFLEEFRCHSTEKVNIADNDGVFTF